MVRYLHCKVYTRNFLFVSAKEALVEGYTVKGVQFLLSTYDAYVLPKDCVCT